MFKASVVMALDVLDAVRDTAKQAPSRMRRSLGILARGAAAQTLIRELATEPGSPHYPLRWKSARQRRYVLAKLRREGNLPYARTHALSRGWRVVLDSIQEGQGIFLIENDNPAMPYVQGDWTQPYHLDTGWPQVAPIIRRYEEPLTDEVINAWWRCYE